MIRRQIIIFVSNQDMMKKYLALIFILISCHLSFALPNIRQISHSEGLTNAAVLDLCQDRDGVVWVGTCDGLSAFYGKAVHPVIFRDGGSIEGSLVEQIMLTGKETLWARTAYGLKRWTRKKSVVDDFSQFQGRYVMRNAGENSLLVLESDCRLSLYDPVSDNFLPVPAPEDLLDNCIDFGCTDTYLWIIREEGVFRLPWSYDQSGQCSAKNVECVSSVPVFSAYGDNDGVYVLDRDANLYHIDIDNAHVSYMLNIKAESADRGMISSVIEMRNHIYISFHGNGIIRCSRDSDGKWTREDLGIKTGIFTLRKDLFQDIVWAASDGQGIFQIWDSEYSVKSVLSSSVHPDIGQPVRCFHRDRSGNLWVGTKGSGLLRITTKGNKLYTESNSSLTDNRVYAFAESSAGGFWIGTDSGLNYFDEKTDRLLPVSYKEKIRLVHDIEEVGDTLLIAVTSEGICKARASFPGGKPATGDVRRYRVSGGKLSTNYFFSMFETSDGRRLFANRGCGAMYIDGDTLATLDLETARQKETVNDVFSITETSGYLWIGTGNGLVRVGKDGSETYLSRENGILPNNTIHMLMPDNRGGLWITTNGGIVRYDTAEGTSEKYGAEKGIDVVEYSDGAAMLDGDTMYFGGINGWVEVCKNGQFIPSRSFRPSIIFSTLTIDNVKGDIYHEFYKKGKFFPHISMGAHDYSLTLEFFINDNIECDDYTFSYQLLPSKIISSATNSWAPVENGVLTLPRQSSGDYALRISAINRANGEKFDAPVITVSYAAPWYASGMMKAFYYFLIALTLFLLVMQERRRHKEALYEEKLAFFTNITHEFKTPLSLMAGPAEKILSDPAANSSVRKNATRIKYNIERLDALVQEIIDYRRLETKHQKCHLHDIDVSALSREVVDNFHDFASYNGITLEQDITDGIRWHMDSKCFVRVMCNLISNALKYTNDGGMIRVGLNVSDGLLRMSVYNTGKGIRPEDFAAVFDRYKVLDNVEETRVSGVTSRNGLGLSICKSTVELLGGRIDVDSKVGEYACFTASFPLLPLKSEDEGFEEPVNITSLLPFLNFASTEKDEDDEVMNVDERPLILAVDDNPEMLRMLSESLPDYQVRTATDVDSAMTAIKDYSPALIISDIMMQGTDGFTLTRCIKENRHTMNIPVILLSAKNTVEDRVHGMSLGADAYIGKPFSIKELNATVGNLINKNTLMKEYFSTSASAFDYAEGRLVSSADKDFLKQVDTYIGKALMAGDATVEGMAAALNISVRNLYRQFKALEIIPPNMYIREQKLLLAARLLRTSTLTIQEIMYQSGFNSRAHFYKEFKARFDIAPKDYRKENRKKLD